MSEHLRRVIETEPKFSEAQDHLKQADELFASATERLKNAESVEMEKQFRVAEGEKIIAAERWNQRKSGLYNWRELKISSAASSEEIIFVEVLRDSARSLLKPLRESGKDSPRRKLHGV